MDFNYYFLFGIILLIILINSNECYQNNKKYKMTIMAIFKNEHEYLQEWIDHHISQGFDHIYLYCNDPRPENYPHLSLPYYKKYITLIHWVDKQNNKGSTIQRQAYTHCVQNYNNEYQYIMMLDIDEFIIHTDHKKKVKDFINLLDSGSTKAIKVQRYNFGSDGHIEKPKGKVMNNYNKHEKICSSYKTLANSDFINTGKDFYGVHDFRYLNKSGKIYNEYFSYRYTGYPIGCKEKSVNEIPLIINHYYTKSYEEYINRCKMWKNGGINNVGYRKNCEKLFKSKDVNEVVGY